MTLITLEVAGIIAADFAPGTVQFGLYLCVVLQGYTFIKVNNLRGSYDDGLQFWFKVETNTVLCWLQLHLVSEKLSH